MLKYLIRRLANYAVMTVLATTLAYMMASAFFDPRKRYLGRNPPISEQGITNILNGMGVNPDVPVLVRTWHWLVKFFTTGSLGTDFSGAEVTAKIMSRASVSLRLLVVGSILGALVGVTLGVWGAVRQYKLSDQVVTYLSYVLISTPTFVSGVLIMVLATSFNNAVGTQVIRFNGEYTAGLPTDFWTQFNDRLIHLILPTIVLTITSAAFYSRYQRSVMLDVLGSDFIRTARAKGATRTRALVRHGVRVALIPMSTYFAFSFGTLLSGATFLELVFNWNGMGRYGVNAVTASDINAAVGAVGFSAILVLMSFMLSEVLYAALDPRVRV